MDEKKINHEYKDRTITLTFGDVCENHVGNQQIGYIADHGFNKDEILKIKEKFEENKVKCEFICLNDYLEEEDREKVEEKGYVMIIRNGVREMLKDIKKDEKDLFKEVLNLEWDKKYWDVRRKKVLNKNARQNLCFSEFSQEPNYEEGKGRIISYDNVKILNNIRNNLRDYFGKKGENLECEGNFYYDVNKCGIGFHGDAERKRVIGIRVGRNMRLDFNWFYKSKDIGERLKLNLNSGDMYIMSEKATGYDWRKRSKYTIRHAAGCDKYLKIKKR